MTTTRVAFLAVLVLLVAGIGFGRAWVSTWTAPPFSPPAPIAVRIITATPIGVAPPTARPHAVRPPTAQHRHIRPKPAARVRIARLPVTQTPTPVPSNTPVPTPHSRAIAHPRHALRRHAASPQPTPTPTATLRPLPTPSPTTGPIELANYWVGSQVARRGQTVAIGYVIDNPTGQVEHLSLGASIKSGRVLNWGASLADPAHDVVAIVPPGLSTHVRYFTLPLGLRPGRYDVAWGLRNALSGNRAALVFAPAVLTVVR